MATAPKPDDGSSLGVAAIGVGALVMGLAATSVALRFYTRIVTRLGLWWDDWLILAAVISTLATAALVLAGNRIDPFGDWVSAGHDPDYIMTANDTLYMKLSYASSILYFTVSGTTKLGILLMYIRIFYMSDGFHTQVVLASALVIAYWIGCTTATLLTCRPMAYIWSSSSGFPRYCFNFNIFWMAAGVCELLLDTLILALPIRAVMSIKLSPRRKLSVIGIFLLGSFVIVSGIVKVILAYNPGGHIPLSGPAEVWVTLHTGLGIVCACLPIFKPLLSRFGRSAFPGESCSSQSDRHGTSEPEGWNIIHLSVGSPKADGDVYRYTADLSSPYDPKEYR